MVASSIRKARVILKYRKVGVKGRKREAISGDVCDGKGGSDVKRGRERYGSEVKEGKKRSAKILDADTYIDSPLSDTKSTDRSTVSSVDSLLSLGQSSV